MSTTRKFKRRYYNEQCKIEYELYKQQKIDNPKPIEQDEVFYRNGIKYIVKKDMPDTEIRMIFK